MAKRYVVEFTESRNNYTYTGEWYQEVVDAVDEEEAIEFVKEMLESVDGSDCVDSSDCYIFRTHEYVK